LFVYTFAAAVTTSQVEKRKRRSSLFSFSTPSFHCKKKIKKQ